MSHKKIHPSSFVTKRELIKRDQMGIESLLEPAPRGCRVNFISQSWRLLLGGTLSVIIPEVWRMLWINLLLECASIRPTSVFWRIWKICAVADILRPKIKRAPAVQILDGLCRKSRHLPSFSHLGMWTYTHTTPMLFIWFDTSDPQDEEGAQWSLFYEVKVQDAESSQWDTNQMWLIAETIDTAHHPAA